jgi:hypothetical protein
MGIVSSMPNDGWNSSSCPVNSGERGKGFHNGDSSNMPVNSAIFSRGIWRTINVYPSEAPPGIGNPGPVSLFVKTVVPLGRLTFDIELASLSGSTGTKTEIRQDPIQTRGSKIKSPTVTGRKYFLTFFILLFSLQPN